MKSLIELWSVTLRNLGSLCGVENTALDFSTVERRVEHEGLSFLTIGLPAFGKDFERALADGRISQSLFQRFPRCRIAPGIRNQEGYDYLRGDLVTRPIPIFLNGFMEKVFDRASGLLLDEPDIDCIFAIRQLTLMYNKILIDCTDSRKSAAYRQYIECEQEIRRSDARMTSSKLEEFSQASSLLWAPVFQQVDEDIYYGRIIPKHGPGSTADRLLGNKKWDQLEWTVRLEHIFPFGENVLPNWRYHSAYSRVNFLEPGAERPVRVIQVPKTQKTPRIIAIEPTCMQYMQQGILAKFVDYIESPRIGTHRVPNPGFGIVNFTDQSVNHRAAQRGSYGSLATLDLSEASDRVSYQLVRTMLQKWPWLSQAVDATRSRSADVPGFGVVRLAKFASMGSALTFPIEAIVFSTLAFMGIAQALNKPLSATLIKEWRDSVLVYGDDILVPADFAPSVMEALESFGFKVNTNKSFWTGKFRESCGREYYSGVDVSVTRIRRVIPSSRTHAEEIVSLVSARNQFYNAGLWQVASYIDDLLRPLSRGAYPIVEETSPILGRVSVSFPYFAEREHPLYHSPLVKGLVVQARPPTNRLDGLGALMKCLLRSNHTVALEKSWQQRLLDLWELPSPDEDHLHRSGRPRSVSTRLRWSSPF